MKKIMTLMLGLSLVIGATTAFADGTDTTKTKKVKKAKKAKKTDTTKS